MIRFASRYLLPAEILLGSMTMSWGISGYFNEDLFWDLVRGTDARMQWCLVLAGVGMAQMSFAMSEHFLGRGWSDCRLYRSTGVRAFFGMLSFVLWAIIAGLLAVNPPSTLTAILLAQTPIALLMSAIILWQNRKIEVLLDPSISTEHLKAAIHARRMTWEK